MNFQLASVNHNIHHDVRNVLKIQKSTETTTRNASFSIAEKVENRSHMYLLLRQLICDPWIERMSIVLDLMNELEKLK